ncbi:MAG: amidohydrolase [Nannocystaceae bacterium]
MPSRRALLRLLAASLAASACGPGRSEPAPKPRDARPRRGRELAELIVRGKILTMDPDAFEAEAVAITGGEITAVGRAAPLLGELRGPKTRVLDLGGGTAVAGLTDAHAHLIGLGRDLEIVDLRGAASIDEVVARLRAGAPASGWILGRGWDQNRWAEGAAMPTHAALTAAFADRPVWLVRVDGHAGWANAAALAAAKIGASTGDPEGGELLRGAGGAPTGVLVDNAMALMPTPPLDAADLRRRLLAAQEHVLARGLTGVHEMGVSAAADAALRELAASGDLRLRVHGYADADWLAGALGERDPDAITATARYLLTGVKLYVDGALGSRGAALLEPYSDRPEHRGTLIQSPERLRELCDRALARRWQIASHAIGDRANRLILDTYAAALAALPEGEAADRRLRIEHAQVLSQDDIPRLRDLGVIASVQPTHATSDMPWAEARLGAARLAGAYAWRRLLDAEVHLALGSDFPVELPDPTHGLYAAITRQDAAGAPAKGWLADQRLALSEALAGFTRGAAYACRRDDHLGLVKRGYQGDLTCFVDDIAALEPKALREAKIRATVIGGEVVYEA